jgi:hypothetical protein
MAMILQHPRSPVVFDPRHQPMSEDATDRLSRMGQPDVDPAPQHAATVLLSYDQPTDSQLEVLDTQDALERIAARIGWPRLATIVRYVAALNGEDVDRPLGNCLADGMLLPPSRVCNFCGRDNN